MVRIHVGAILLALAVIPLVASCSATTEPTATQAPSSATVSSPPTSTPSLTTSPTPTSAVSASSGGIANAEQAVVTMWATVDRLVNDPRLSLQALDGVTTDGALTLFQQNLGKYRAAQWKGSGSSVVSDLHAVSTGVDAQGDPGWTVTACVDGSKTTLVDQSGKSVQGPPYRIQHQATVISRGLHQYVSSDTAVGTC